MIFIYLQSLLNVFSIRIPFQRFNRLRMGAAFPSQNDHLLSKQGIVWLLFFLLYRQVTPHLKNRKRVSKGQMLARKGESAGISTLWEKTGFFGKYSFKTLYTVTESLSSVMSVESKDCRWLLVNLKLATQFSLKWNWYMEHKNFKTWR